MRSQILAASSEPEGCSLARIDRLRPLVEGVRDTATTSWANRTVVSDCVPKPPPAARPMMSDPTSRDASKDLASASHRFESWWSVEVPA
jgi:hypothetical protein